MQKKCLLSLIGLSMFLSAAAQNVPVYVPQNNLVGWWAFSGNARDSSVNANNGTVSGALLGVDRFNNPNSAYVFNGTIDKITVPSTGVTSVTRTTVSAWIKYTGNANTVRSYDTYFNFGELGSHSFAYAYDYVDTNINVWRGCTGTRFTPKNLNGQWRHLVVVQDSLITRMYVDGSLVDTTRLTNAVCLQGGSNLIFGAAPAESQWMTGSLDDIGFWTRALSECEVYNLYNSAQPLAIATQPTSQAGNLSGTATFTCLSNLGTSASYQWQSNIGAGGSFIDLTNVGQYSGVTTNTLTVSGLLTTNTNQKFRCVVNRGPCIIQSSEATLSVIKTSVNNVGNPNVMLGQSYPNPMDKFAVIEYTLGAFNESASIVLNDVSGKIIRSIALPHSTSGKIELDRSVLANGMYFYSLYIDGMKYDTKRLIVN